MKTILSLFVIFLLTVISCSEPNEDPNLGPEFSGLKPNDTIPVQFLTSDYAPEVVPDWHGEVGNLEMQSSNPGFKIINGRIYYEDLKIGNYQVSITAKNKFGEDKIDLIFQAKLGGRFHFIDSGIQSYPIYFDMKNHFLQFYEADNNCYSGKFRNIGIWQEMGADLIEGQFYDDLEFIPIKSFRLKLTFNAETGVPSGTGDWFDTYRISENSKVGSIKLVYEGYQYVDCGI